ncbi:MAG: glycosyltransferase family 2 protein [Gammaproteobacteria bacterium]|nr:glycosyltransferase family 2 protein [Gammaproteobacteria bacterium]
MLAFNPCILIPIYNNKDTIRDVVRSLEYLNLPCLVIDDGSDESTRQVLQQIDADFTWVSIIHRTQNAGKGAAMATGFRAAVDLGYTHAVQLDADGQHNASDVPRFLERARGSPEALILSKPIFDDNAPAVRRYGRWVTTFWVCIETWSVDIKDALCGFRCYPLQSVMQLYQQTKIGAGMVFDTEIAVRLHWNGVPMVNVETQVDYAKGGLSHFRYLEDNLRIIRLHTELVLGMVLRIPRLLLRSRT